MPSPDRTLVCPQQPSFQQRCYPVDAWHYHMGGLWKGREDGLLADISPLGEFVVSLPAIGVHDRAWLNGTAYERHKATRANIGNPSQPNSSESLRQADLDGNHNDGLLLSLPATLPLLKTTDVGLIDFHEAAEPLAP